MSLDINIAMERSRRDVSYFYRWLDMVDDASGIEGEWTDAPSEPARALLAIAGDTYLPFLSANEEALRAGHETFSLELDGKPYTQGVFKYQLRCLMALREAWKDLPEDSRVSLTAMIGKNAILLDA